MSVVVGAKAGTRLEASRNRIDEFPKRPHESSKFIHINAPGWDGIRPKPIGFIGEYAIEGCKVALISDQVVGG